MFVNASDGGGVVAAGNSSPWAWSVGPSRLRAEGIPVAKARVSAKAVPKGEVHACWITLSLVARFLFFGSFFVFFLASEVSAARSLIDVRFVCLSRVSSWRTYPSYTALVVTMVGLILSVAHARLRAWRYLETKMNILTSAKRCFEFVTVESDCTRVCCRPRWVFQDDRTTQLVRV